ncbi:Abi family protein [Longimicrobium sp.]|uniref:Abi family protein n=1 Tax=Longimicrobium sp. TaxID=2029185 RepID=UPI002E2FC4E7|nr:Abi family protein [Longimicrobium sp.]HEX6037236.1 Abi family protein [Longimicrobium sp.]
MLAHLISRGLGVPDEAQALSVLGRIDYYRLLVYMRPFQQRGAETGARTFVPGTSIGDILALYEFDRELRLLSLDAVERVEVALRAAVVSEVAVQHGAHFYLQSKHFTTPDAWARFNAAVQEEAPRHAAGKHYLQNYDTPPAPPIWVAMEASTFGTLSHMFSNLQLGLRRAISRRFGYDEVVLTSWFRSLTILRNIAAHHGRLWDAPLTADKPLKAKRIKDEFGQASSKFFPRAVVAAALLDALGQGGLWRSKFRALMDAHPFVDEERMGCLPGWRSRPFWNP